MEKLKKKAFTLVELLVVIAIVAILATVAVVGYTSFTRKASISNDELIVSQMNLALKANEALDQKAKYPTEAIKQVYDAGFIYENLTPTTNGFHIAYDQEYNNFMLLSDTYEVTYCASQATDHVYSMFVVVNDEKELLAASDKGFSVYLNENFVFDENNTKNSLNINAGIDFGNCDSVKEIVYENTTDEAKKIVFYTNYSRLNIKAKIGDSKETSDEIIHYGYAQKIEASVANYCLITHGTIGTLVLKTGKIIADEGGFIYLMKAAKGTIAQEENGGVIIIPQGMKSDDIDTDVAESLGYKVDSNNIIVVDEKTEKGQSKKSQSAYTVSSADELYNLRDAFYAGKFNSDFKIILCNDIDISAQEWTPVGNWEYPFHGTLDGQGYTIKGLTAKTSFDDEGVYSKGRTTGFGQVFGFFGIVGDGDVTICNVKFTDVSIVNANAQNVGVLVGYAPTSANFSDTDGKGGTYVPGKWNNNTTVGKTNININNVSISGVLNVKAHVGGFIGKIYSEASATLTNCTNNTRITSNDIGGLAGFIGYCTTKAKLVKCVNTKESSLDYQGSGSVRIADYVASSKEHLEEREIINCTSDISLPNFSGLTLSAIYNCCEKELVIKDCTVKNVNNYGALTINNATISEDLINRGSVTVNGGNYKDLNNYGKATINNGATFSTSVINQSTGVLTINNITSKDTVTNYGKLTIENGSFKNLKNYKTATINNGTFSGKLVIGAESVSTVINNGDFAGTYSNSEKAPITINGGKYAFNIMSIIDYSKYQLVFENSRFKVINKDKVIKEANYKAYCITKVNDIEYKTYFDTAQNAFKFKNATLLEDGQISNISLTSTRTITLNKHKANLSNVTLKKDGSALKLTITGSEGEEVTLTNITVGELSIQKANASISSSKVTSITLLKGTSDCYTVLEVKDASLNNVVVKMGSYTRVVVNGEIVKETKKLSVSETYTISYK